MKEAILVIDVQNDYFPGGQGELFESEKTAEVIKRLIDAGRNEGKEIIYVQHINEGQSFFAPNTFGCEIYDKIKPKNGERVFVKHVPSSFCQTGLADYLKEKNITKLTICGMMTHMCVDTSVRAAQDYGIQMDVVANACATKDLEYNGEILPAPVVQKVFMASLKGMFANVIEF